jgi:hypothetical protein
MNNYLSEEITKKLEQQYIDGITSVDVVKIFRDRGFRFSQSTFRKYVQLGLLPRSFRISAGNKGKHRGSKGVYPFAVVKKINEIKRMMSEGLTLDDIVRASQKFSQEIIGLDSGLQKLFKEMKIEVDGPHFDLSIKPMLKMEIETARGAAKNLISQLEQIDEILTRPRPTL